MKRNLAAPSSNVSNVHAALIGIHETQLSGTTVKCQQFSCNLGFHETQLGGTTVKCQQMFMQLS